MLKLQKDIDELFASRKSLVRSGNHTSTLSSIYSIRPLIEDAPPILYLLHAPKKFIKLAHERNKLKRWMREALRTSDEFESIKDILIEKELQVLLLIRADFRPSKNHSCQHIQDDVRSIAIKLTSKLK